MKEWHISKILTNMHVEQLKQQRHPNLIFFFFATQFEVAKRP
jgi:hypothetical protein